MTAPERGKAYAGNRIGIQAGSLVHALWGILSQEAIWKNHSPNFQSAVQQPVPGEEV